jgi:hypothetical protein
MAEGNGADRTEKRRYGWAKTYSIHLPSGAWVKVRPANMATMVRTGQIRKELAGVSARAAREIVQGRAIDYEQMGAFLEALLGAVLVEPTLEQVGFANIPEGDVSAIFQWVNGSYAGEREGEPDDAALATFPDGAGQPAA